MDPEGTNANHKWRKTELSDFAPIRPTDEQCYSYWINCASHPVTTFVLMKRVLLTASMSGLKSP